MKKLILALAVMLTTLTASAKSKWSTWDIVFMPHVGASYSYMNSNENSWKLGVAGGVAFQIYFSPKWAMDIDINYTHLGAKEQYQWLNGNETGPYDYRLDYINADYLFRYYPVGKLSIGTGVHLGRLINAKSEYQGKSTNIKDDLHQGLISIPAVLAYDFGDFTVDARYYFPLNTLPESHRAKEILKKQAREISFMVTVGYKIQLF